jgi:penicillin-binding protein 1B
VKKGDGTAEENVKKTSSFSRIRIVWIVCAVALAAALLSALWWLKQLNDEISDGFDGKRWSLPAVVYARPLELYPGMRLSPAMFESELQLAGYREEEDIQSSGGYHRAGAEFELISRDFPFPSGIEKSKSLAVSFKDNHIAGIIEQATLKEVDFVRLDPARIGSFHPLVHEDRIVIEKEQIPDLLRQTLMAVEDKNFLHHHGISFTGIGRAMLANAKAGRTVQGGSTLTQQLVKNFFLTSDRTFSRKIREAVMALLLEFRYSKDEIITAYVNEVFLGQDGARAIHGFGMASQFYFRRNLSDLTPSQTATLVGMVKGPSLYDPYRNPEKSLAGRNVVLETMLAENVIDRTIFSEARDQPLTDVSPQKNGLNRFPAFLELVRRQLIEEYREEDLRGSGVKILTTLDPMVQITAEEELQRAVTDFERHQGGHTIEGAVVITARETGEVQAVIGGKKPQQQGFNRALDARRAIGSLIKPAVYLAALEEGYTLASPLNDSAITLENKGSRWKPKNYDHMEHGRVALYKALAESYNLAAVRLGVAVGIPRVLATLNRLGYPHPLEPYPSILLGSIGMTPLQVTQFYQTIASGGFYQPLRSIQAVIAEDGRLLKRYGLEVEQRFAPETMFLLNHALKRVMEEGTGRKLRTADGLSFAGKTGTTDDLRDSWFAGFSGDRLALVWLGNDDNRTISLSGSGGALPVWGKIMEAIDSGSLEQSEPPGIVWRRIDKTTLRWAGIFNRNSTVLPFVLESHNKTIPVASKDDREGSSVQ